MSNIKSEIPEVEVLDPTSATTYTLEYLPPTMGHKTLGHYKDPSGLQKNSIDNSNSRATVSLTSYGLLP